MELSCECRGHSTYNRLGIHVQIRFADQHFYWRSPGSALLISFQRETWENPYMNFLDEASLTGKLSSRMTHQTEIPTSDAANLDGNTVQETTARPSQCGLGSNLVFPGCREASEPKAPPTPPRVNHQAERGGGGTHRFPDWGGRNLNRAFPQQNSEGGLTPSPEPDNSDRLVQVV